MNRLAALRATVAELERTYRALGGNGYAERHATEGLSGHRGPGLGVGRGEAQVRAGGHGGHGGNPYHDAEGKFASGPGGSSAAKRRRRHRKREALRKKWKAAAKAARKDWRGYRSGVRSDRRRDFKAMMRRHGREKASFREQVGKERAAMKGRHAEERREIAEAHKETLRDEMKGHVEDDVKSGYRGPEIAEVKQGLRDRAKQAIRQDLAEARGRHRGERQALARAHRDRWEDLKDTHESERAEHRDEYREKREGTEQDIADEKAAFHRELREDIVKHFPKWRPKGETDASRAGLRPGGPGLQGDLAGRPGAGEEAVARDTSHRFGAGRHHKAGSAEAILGACLRRLGYTARWEKGRLTGRQALKLLAAVRDHARAWMHHECEQLIRQHGRRIDERDGDQISRQERHAISRESSLPEMASGDVDRFPAQEDGFRDGPQEGDFRSQNAEASATAGDRSGLSEVVCRMASIPSDPGHGDGDLLTRSLSSAVRRHVGRFFDRAKTFVREAIVAGAMALAGPGGLTADDLDEVDRQAQVQVAFLDQFRRDVEARGPAELSEPAAGPVEGAMSAAEMAARAEMYGSSAWQGAMHVNRRGVINDGKAVRERRFHRLPNPEGHACKTCLEQSGLGWVPVGTLLPIGDAECLTNCDCYFVYELADGSNFITRRGWQRAA